MEKRSLFVRILALMLCVIMIGAVLASCASDDDEPKRTVKKEKETEQDTPTFVDYDGREQEFVMLSAQNEATDFTDCYIDNEDVNGEPINDAVVERNKLVEEKYNVNISRRAETTGYARQASQSGTVDFQVVYDWGFRLVPGVMDGIFYDVNLLSSDYVDLDASYWAPSSHEDLTVAGKLLVFTCDISMNRIAWASFIAFNKKLMDQFGLEYPYTYVQNNTWTYDKYLELVTDAYLDNGDGIWDQNDIYGSSGIGVGNVVDSTGWKGYTKTEEGRYELDFQLDKLQQIYSTYSVKFTGNAFEQVDLNDWNKLVDTSKFKSIYRASRFASFGQDHIMMTGFTMDETYDLNGMESQYGVVPMPKYDASQTEYYHYIDTCAPMFAIMKQADDELTAIVLEYMNYESQNLLLPAFFEQTIKTKRMSDPDEEMLDIIRDSVHYKFGGIYGLYGIFDASGSGWDPIGTIRSEMLANGQFKSVLNKYQSAAKVSLDKFFDTIEDMDVTK